MDAQAQKLAALEQELRKDLEAVERVRRLMETKSVAAPDDRQLPLPVGFGLELIDETETNDESTGSIIGTIEQLLNADPNVRWTTLKVLNQLKAIGYPLRAAKPIYSVGQSLSKLVKQGKIRLVKKGSGNSPHVYRGKAPATQTTEDSSQGEKTNDESLAMAG